MDLDKELAEYRQRAQRWLAGNIEPRADSLDGAPRRRYDRTYIDSQRAIQRAIYAAGYAGISWPVDYGGQGLSERHQKVFSDAARAYRLPDFGHAAITTGTCAKTIRDHADEEFKRRHLPRILSGDELWVQFLSEPGAGSDLAAVQLRASRDGTNWRLTGSKIWTTFGHLADWGLCIARTNWDVPKHQGVTWFAVPTDADGLTIRPIRQLTGYSEFCEEFFDDVVVPDTSRIGAVDDGWSVTTTLLRYERGAERQDENDGGVRRLDGPGPLAPDLVNLARAADTTGDRVVRQLIARAHGRDYLLGELSHWLATAAKRGAVNPSLASYLKLARGTFTPDRAITAIRIAGGGGVAWPQAGGPFAGVADTYLAARQISIAAGTNEMQRNTIGDRILGLPRERGDDRDTPFRDALRNRA